MYQLKEEYVYKPGLTELQVMQEYSLNKVIKLGSNENPYNPNANMLNIMHKALLNVNRYPDDAAASLMNILSIKNGLPTNQLLLGNGSSELLDLIVQAMVKQGDQVIVSDYAFSLYKVLCKMARAEVVSIPENNYNIDLEGMLAKISQKTTLIFITNPGNPTGTYLSYEKLSSFLSRVPRHITVVIDEAYYEYVHVTDYKSALLLLSQYENVVIARTFSKAYGLAGLRIGYALSSKSNIDRIRMYRKPFSVNSVALAAAFAALEDEDALRWTILSNQIELRKAEIRLNKMRLTFIPSVTNFISVNLSGLVDVINQALLKRGIIARTLKEYGLDNYLRFSIGSADENQLAFDALESCFKEIEVH